LIRSLLDAGILTTAQNGFVATREIKAVDVPETLQNTLMTRIDRLKPQIKGLLFSVRPLSAAFFRNVFCLACIKIKRVKRTHGLAYELQRRQFVRLQEETADKEYLFKHAITHDVRLQFTPPSRGERELHQLLVAEALEKLFPDRLRNYRRRWAIILSELSRMNAAANYLGRAAERARATFANTEALGFYQSAIDQIKRLDPGDADVSTRSDAARLNEGLGDRTHAHWATGGGAECL